MTDPLSALVERSLAMPTLLRCPSCHLDSAVDHYDARRKSAQVVCDECGVAGPRVDCLGVGDESAFERAAAAWNNLPREAVA